MATPQAAPQSWRNRIVRHALVAPEALEPSPWNWRTHPSLQRDALVGSLTEIGWIQQIVVNERTGHLIDGHLRLALALEGHEAEVPVLYVDLSEAEEKLALATLDPLSALAETNKVALDGLLREVQSGNSAVQQLLAQLAEEQGLVPSQGGDGESLEDPEPQLDRAEELRKEWGVELGQLWQCGEHRLVCGDCTDKAVIERLMQGQQAILCHADPPYGMGKEAEGIANDNLYASKLDAFQMRWWQACRAHLAENASVYIWGNAEDLWRLWYQGGLQASERLTFRNELVWDKAVEGENPTMLVMGIPLENRRMYQPTERCLFFMLGEQGFSTNADNYWEGWEPIRAYLEQERVKMGWDVPTMKRLVGHSDLSRDHWTSKSQWSFPTREVYEALQQAARGDGFKRDYDGFKRDYDDLKRDYDDLKRDYDDLKRDYYATRAYFDNTHDNMTDVWDCPRVHGEDRHGHPTPKPVALIARMVKSSTPAGALVYEPFLGSGTTLIACEQLQRHCYACELSPAYTAVTLQRWADLTGQTPVLVR